MSRGGKGVTGGTTGPGPGPITGGPPGPPGPMTGGGGAGEGPGAGAGAGGGNAGGLLISPVRGPRRKLIISELLAGLGSIVTPGLLLVNPGEAARNDSISALW